MALNDVAADGGDGGGEGGDPDGPAVALDANGDDVGYLDEDLGADDDRDED